SIPMVTSSGTSTPRSMYPRACRPSGVPAARWARNMSPVAMCGSPVASDTSTAWVPLPAPGGPNSRMSRATSPDALPAEEALVVAHHELRLHLPHGVERHPHDDQDGRAAEPAGRGLREPSVADEDVREHGDDPEVDRAGERQPGQDAVQVLR